MNQRHVPSLELCQELDRLCKEKGIVVPKIEFYWEREQEFDYLESEIEDGFEYDWVLSHKDSMIYCEPEERCIPAPLVSELGEWLPETVEMYNEGEDVKCFRTYLKGHQKKHRVDYLMAHGQATTMELWEDDTEANARQKMLNYLIAEGIITTL